MVTSKLTSYRPFTCTVEVTHSPQRTPQMWVKRAVTPYRHRCTSVELAQQQSPCASVVESPQEVQAGDEQVVMDCAQPELTADPNEPVEMVPVEPPRNPEEHLAEDLSIEIVRPWPTACAA
ncbi:hypothetical protein H310_05344 [Aphanomyces invadans]|uniref:Uncharacterized protein n=1 Tax=Aphanomyces invadans TaxID=157072 RepID=A0A024UAH4_9STRA|nr:hypothetical protein H310_05344 [Aphanomyces invadans]ETW02872.1 hypothetical protein H310_05344 [Aphanomyces invadans]|eukprot:XP_008868256.1 hypothetical protein H310_05344 [Aphanomyces invadans]